MEKMLIKREKKINKFIACFLVLTTALIICAVVSIKSSLCSRISFYLFGIWALYFITILFYYVIKIAKIKIGKKELILISGGLGICLMYYIITMLNTRQIYTWDLCNYYTQQVNLLGYFGEGFLSGIKQIITSTFRSDYGDFLLSFTSMLFKFTSKTENDFIVVYSIVGVLPVVFSFMLVVLKLIQKFEYKNKEKILVLCNLFVISFPLLHKSAYMGQPDIFGILWLNIIVILTIDYLFEKRDWYRWSLIIISSFLMVITRRWYLFWIIGYFISYAISIVIHIFKQKEKTERIEILKNGIIFAISFLIVVGILLFPVIRRTIIANYGTSYGAWNVGGITTEIKNQFLYIGLLTLIIIICGMIYSVINKKILLYELRIIMTLFITLFLFTRIQNMGYHQSLILAPEYIVLSVVGVISLLQFKNEIINIINMVVVSIIFILGYYGSITNKLFYNSVFYSNISLAPVYRTDYEEVSEIVDFIKNNTNENDKVYVNAADGKYCGQTFSQFIMPDRSLIDIVAYESSVDSVHGFPVELLEAKYVFLTNKVLESTGAKQGTLITNIKNEIENNEKISKKYKMIKEYKIDDEITFYVYERIEKVDKEETQEWEKAFKEQSELYPKLYKERIDEYINEVV